jgi:hypothetical protein
VIRRFYVHNFRGLDNFELPILGQSSVILIENNGSGKTSVGLALEILQKIARGTNRVNDLVKPKDLSCGRTDVPVRFEIEVELKSGSPQITDIYEYVVALDIPAGSKELRVLEEKLSAGGQPIYTRNEAQVHLHEAKLQMDRPLSLQALAVPKFRIDWRLVALPIVQEQSQNDPLYIFKQWLARMLILRPTPGLITGDSTQETLEPNLDVTNFGAWFSELLAYAPDAYAKIDQYLKQVMPDLKDIKNTVIGRDS